MKNTYQDSLQSEVDASYLYKKIASAQDNQHIKEIFSGLSEIENEHATSMLKSIQKRDVTITTLPFPSIRAKTLNIIGKYFGYDYIIATMVGMEKSIALEDKRKKLSSIGGLEGNEDNHVKILENLLKHKSSIAGGQDLGKVEGKHTSIGGNALRAAVLGANDGLVSNMSLVMGVAGATAGGQGVLLAGMAGLLAGALSMSLGEWISVRSSQELYERQMDLEMDEIEHNPEGETKELILIYMAKGIKKSEAKKIAKEVMKDTKKAHTILVREELGFNTDELNANPWEAAIASFIFFGIGAIIPVFPFFFYTGAQAIIISVIASTFGLFIIGAAITLFTGKSVWYSGIRQVIFGLLAALITYSIGALLGVSLT